MKAGRQCGFRRPAGLLVRTRFQPFISSYFPVFSCISDSVFLTAFFRCSVSILIFSHDYGRSGKERQASVPESWRLVRAGAKRVR
jgi:hypothetical protein